VLAQPRRGTLVKLECRRDNCNRNDPVTIGFTLESEMECSFRLPFEIRNFVRARQNRCAVEKCQLAPISSRFEPSLRGTIQQIRRHFLKLALAVHLQDSIVAAE